MIANNRKRIVALGETAQRIYREWFVDFRYPGHEAVLLVDSEWGPIPEGWLVRRLVDVAQLTMGQSPPSSAYNRAGLGLPFHQGVGSFGEVVPVHTTYSTSGERQAEPGDVLVSVRAPVGRINIADRRLILGRGLSGIRARGMPRSLLTYALKHIFREEDSMGNGAIFNAVTKAEMEGIRFAVPPEDLRLRFDRIVGPGIESAETATHTIAGLRSARDLLLPRLISGAIDVDNLDFPNGEATA